MNSLSNNRKMRFAPFMIAAAALLPALGQGQVTVLPQIADGGNWYTTIVLENTTTNAAQATLVFAQNIGGGVAGPWNPPFVEVTSTQNMLVAAGGTVSIHTPGTATALTQGWCQVLAPVGVVAYAIYTYESFAGRPNQDGTSQALAATSRVLVPFDATSGYSTGVALVNPTAVNETVSVNIQLDNGFITQATLPSIATFGQMAFDMATQFPSVAGHKGLAEFYVLTGNLAAAAFRINPTVALTSIPVVPGNGAPVIGGSSSGSVTPYVTFSATSLSYQPAGFPSGTVSLSLNLNSSGGTYLTSINGGFPDADRWRVQQAREARSAQERRAAKQRRRFRPTVFSPRREGRCSWCRPRRCTSLWRRPLHPGECSSEALTGTLTVTGTPYPGGGTPTVTISGPISGNHSTRRCRSSGEAEGFKETEARIKRQGLGNRSQQ